MFRPEVGSSKQCYMADGVTLPCIGLAKQARPISTTCSFKGKLCPVACIKTYEEATGSIRKEYEGERTRFFLAVIPHNPLSIKKSLSEAGLGDSYTAHSTRSASTTAAAMSGISTKEITSGAERTLFQVLLQITGCGKI